MRGTVLFSSNKKYITLTILLDVISVNRMMEFYCPHLRLIDSQMTSKLFYRDDRGWPRYAGNLYLCFLSCEWWISVLWKACLDKFVSVKTCSDMTFSGWRQDHRIRSDVFEIQWVVLLRIHQKAGPLQDYLEHKKAKAFICSWAVTPRAIASYLS